MSGNLPLRGASAAAACIVGLAAVQTSRAAAPTGSPEVTDSGAESCPGSQDVRAEIVRLVPPQELHRLESPVRVRVEDEGASYVVRVFDGTAETVREHHDEGRHCQVRARFAAVFTVLTLMPPEVMLALEALPDDSNAEEDTPEPTGPEPAIATPKRPPPQTDVVVSRPPKRQHEGRRTRGPRAELAARYSWITPVAGAIDYRVPGVELRATLPWPGSRWQPVAALGADPRQRFEIAERGIAGDVVRGDLGLGLRFEDPRDRYIPWLDALLVGRAARWRGRDLLENRVNWELSPGLRLGAGLGLVWGRLLVPFLEARGALYPLPAQVSAQPTSDVGKTSVVELSIAAGVGWQP